MRRYKSINMKPDGIEQYELGLTNDGNFMWLMTRSDEAGTVSHTARGRWVQMRDLMTFEIIDASSESAPLPTTAIVHGDRLELAGFGMFG